MMQPGHIARDERGSSSVLGLNIRHPHLDEPVWDQALTCVKVVHSATCHRPLTRANGKTLYIFQDVLDNSPPLQHIYTKERQGSMKWLLHPLAHSEPSSHSAGTLLPGQHTSFFPGFTPAGLPMGLSTLATPLTWLTQTCPGTLAAPLG